MIGKFVIVAAMLAVAPASARACPVCDREAGRQVRAGIFDQQFGFNLVATALPFGVFLGIVAVIHFGLPRGRAAAPGPNHGPDDDTRTEEAPHGDRT